MGTDISKWTKGWSPVNEESFIEWISEVGGEVCFIYEGHEYEVEPWTNKDGRQGYALRGIEDEDPLDPLHFEETIEDFMARGFMGKPLQPIIDDSYITVIG